MSEPTAIAERFYAGRYADVLALTVDRADLAFSDVDLPFVVGALAFVGRIEEARALLGSVHASTDMIAPRFFLGVALCRAGRSSVAEREFRANLRAGYRHPDARVRFYVFQGLACLRYFGGRMDRAARLSLRALGAAYEARFQYGRLLATDLRGHALVQMGMPATGLQLLEQACALATHLGLDGNASAIACASAVYAARAGSVPLDDVIARLETIAREAKAQDSYSVRTVELELARQYALGGRSDAAWALLERIAARPAPDGDRRARVRLMLAFALVALLRYGRSSAQTYVSEARSLLAKQDDLGLEADVLRMELACTPDVGARARLDEVEARIGIDTHRPANVEDRVGANITSALSGESAAARDAVDRGYLGLLPISLGRDPAQRIVVLAGDGRLLVGDGGNVRVSADVAPSSLRLLAALADGVWHEKSDLVHRVWELRVYRPERHASVVHTAISRLRATLMTAGHWIEGRGGAYRLAPDVSVITTQRKDDLAPCDPTDADSEVETPIALRTSITEEGGETAAPDENAQIAAHLARLGPMSTGELARVLHVSEMTVLRRLKELMLEGRVVRAGRGRATRYQAVGSGAPEGVLDHQPKELP
ncbi:MAG: hypothetical protein K0S65_2004 [Labilithrix sp.]|nr:hypothetical protein [Labilithrix sp.]